MSNGEIRISKVTLWQAIAGILFVLLLVSIFTHGFRFGGEASPTGGAAAEAKPAEQPQKEQAPTIDVKNLNLEGVSFLGKKDAPVTIVVYDDFQCPFCARFETQTWPELKKTYVDTGKVKFYFKHFPLGFHPNAKPASEATECAGEQGKFWKMHDKIFANQGELSEENLKKWAEELGLDTTKFNECFDSHKYSARVEKDIQEGQSIGVQGTPSFVIQDELLVGAQPFSAFKEVIDKKLK
ncbi:MAG: DsbA family protein [Candidatus Woesearchaeota archaeon]